MDGVQQTLRGLPLLLRYSVTGAVALGVLGAAVGLVLGLWAYRPTAWAATFEVGLPASVLGAVGGAVVASAVHLVHAVHRRRFR